MTFYLSFPKIVTLATLSTVSNVATAVSSAGKLKVEEAKKLRADESESALALANSLAENGDGASLMLAYESFLVKHKVRREKDSVSFEDRLSAFVHSHKAVKAHNKRSVRSWTAGINKFADWTHAEKQVMLGFRRLGEWWNSANTTASKQLKKRSFLQTKIEVADAVDWRSSAPSSFVRDQGSCGSCWAVAAAGALEMRAEMTTKKPVKSLAFKQLVDCVPNPRHCGGSGGCEGATPQLAFQYVQENGLSSSYDYGGSPDKTESCRASSASVVVKTSGFVSLPTNKLQPLMEAVNEGPVVVSVDGGPWMSYNGGVFNECKQDATINHAVLAVGYGRDNELNEDYWLIRNSWGGEWGEEGYIRIKRHQSDSGDEGYCGTDYDPKEGSGCDGGPKTLPVCGMCGILSDSAYPEDVAVQQN
eukprot:TRINITY_DN1553_c0_g1_i1.p1 TRINITY_DN1553_c0_g1~~TRINITY_DN1553_c0_g1_i1.p1  ORF type:complete len:418 (+),score=95.55 TRINITY_DN1553_c0_g1_i1:126-1379(+)